MKRNLNQPIGIIGGMGPQASAELLRILIGMVSKDFGVKNDEDFPEIILNSVPVPNFISNKENMEKVLNILKRRIKNLERFNPSCFAIACNTAHLFLADLQNETDIPFVSIIDEVTRRVVNSGTKRVCLLGSPVTIRSKLYQTRLERGKIKVVTPSKSELLIIEEVIRNVLAGKISDGDKQELISIANSSRLKGAQGIILGCTELPLVFPKRFPIPVFDSIEILAKSLLKRAYEIKNKNSNIKI